MPHGHKVALLAHRATCPHRNKLLVKSPMFDGPVTRRLDLSIQSNCEDCSDLMSSFLTPCSHSRFPRDQGCVRRDEDHIVAKQAKDRAAVIGEHRSHVRLMALVNRLSSRKCFGSAYTSTEEREKGSCQGEEEARTENNQDQRSIIDEKTCARMMTYSSLIHILE